MSSEGTIVRRVGEKGDVSYLLRYYVESPENGQRRRVNTTVHVGTDKEAKRELRRLLTQADQGTHVDPKKMTVGEWADTWISVHANQSVSAKTLERYTELLNLHVKPHMGSHALQKLSTIHIDNLYAKLRVEGKRSRKLSQESATAAEPSGLSEQTILHVHRVLSRLLSVAVKKRLLARNPAEDATAPRPKARKGTGDSKKIEALDRVQLRVLVTGLSGKDLFTLVAVAAGTGMRRGELLGLRWSDIDFEQGKIRIQQSVEQTRAGIQFKEPKNSSSKRTIGIDRGLTDLLGSLRKGQADLLKKFGAEFPPDALLFPKDPLEPKSPMKPEHVSKKFAVAAKQGGFPNLRFHDLRHTHATLLLTAGVPVNVVATRLGHSTPVVTLTVYGHVIRQAEEQAVAVSGTFLDGAIPARESKLEIGSAG